MNSNPNSAQFGRVKIDADGISQNPLLFFFGKKFEVKWSNIIHWSNAETVKVSADGKEEIAYQILEIRSINGVNHISRSGTNKHYPLIVEQLRKTIPEKETDSILSQIKSSI